MTSCTWSARNRRVANHGRPASMPRGAQFGAGPETRAAGRYVPQSRAVSPRKPPARQRRHTSRSRGAALGGRETRAGAGPDQTPGRATRVRPAWERRGPPTWPVRGDAEVADCRSHRQVRHRTARMARSSFFSWHPPAPGARPPQGRAGRERPPAPPSPRPKPTTPGRRATSIRPAPPNRRRAKEHTVGG